jgi:hypothetical protein
MGAHKTGCEPVTAGWGVIREHLHFQHKRLLAKRTIEQRGETECLPHFCCITPIVVDEEKIRIRFLFRIRIY